MKAPSSSPHAQPPPPPPASRPSGAGDPDTPSQPSLWLAWRASNRFMASALGGRIAVRTLLALIALITLILLTTDTGNLEGFRRWASIYFQFVIPFSCLAICGSVIRNEVQQNTIGFLLTRPITRARLVVVRYLSAVLILQVNLAATTILLTSAGLFREIDAWSFMRHLLLVQVLAIFSWGALSLLFGLLTSKPVLWAFIYGFIVEFGIGRIPTNINNLSVLRHLKTLLAHNEVWAEAHSGWSTDGTLKSLIILFLAPALVVALSSIVFTVREYLPSTEAQK